MGGGKTQAAPSPKEEADAQIQIDEAKAAREATAADKKAAADKVDYDARVAKSLGKRTAARSNAEAYGTGQLATKGITDNYGIMNAYRSALDRAGSTIPEDDQNPDSYFGTSLFDTAYDTARTGQRNKLSRDLGNRYDDTFSGLQFGDTADDTILSGYLGDQYNDALGTIDRARDRGTLASSSYDRALKELGNQKSIANTKLQGLGGGVLSGYRKQIDDSLSGEKKKISEYDFGDNLNLDTYGTQLGNLTNQLKGSLAGDITTAIGDQTFFDPTALLKKVNTLSGVTNNKTATPLQDAFSNQIRSQGNTGAF